MILFHPHTLCWWCTRISAVFRGLPTALILATSLSNPFNAASILILVTHTFCLPTSLRRFRSDFALAASLARSAR